MIGKTIQLHNGKFFINIKITEDMIGHKLGEFVPTRLRHIYKKKNKWVKNLIQIAFQLSKKSNNIFFSAFNSLEYSNYLKDYLSISSNLINFFEKNKCIVKDCHVMLNNDKSFLTIFISFVVLSDISKKSNNNFLEYLLFLKNFGLF